MQNGQKVKNLSKIGHFKKKNCDLKIESPKPHAKIPKQSIAVNNCGEKLALSCPAR